MYVATASDRARLRDRLASRLEADTADVGTRRFPDGELHVRVEDELAGEAVVLADLRPDEELVTALLACDAAREAGADRVTVAAPYLAYGRQDRAFETGEAVSARALLRALAGNADAFATVDPHASPALDYFEGPAGAAGAAPELAGALEGRGVELVLAPDEGARERARAVAERLAVPADHLEKRRISAREVEVEPHEGDVDGRTVALVDDIVSTGGTMATATRQLLDAGADAVHVAATHGIFAEGALKRLQDAGADAVLATDAIPSPAAEVSVAPALARAVRRARPG